MYAVQRICLMVSDKTVSARDAGRNALQGQLLPRRSCKPVQKACLGKFCSPCKRRERVRKALSAKYLDLDFFHKLCKRNGQIFFGAIPF